MSNSHTDVRTPRLHIKIHTDDLLWTTRRSHKPIYSVSLEQCSLEFNGLCPQMRHGLLNALQSFPKLRAQLRPTTAEIYQHTHTCFSYNLKIGLQNLSLNTRNDYPQLFSLSDTCPFLKQSEFSNPLVSHMPCQ